MARLLDLVGRQDARHRLIIAIGCAIIAALGLHGRVRLPTELIIVWDVFAGVVLILAWLTIVTTPRHKLRLRAKQQDLSRTLIFGFVVVAACAGLFAVGFLLRTNRGEFVETHLTAHLIMTLIAVIFSWFLVHTVFGLRYAHTFYSDSDGRPGGPHAGGLKFPDEDQPDYLDFAYFAFVVGMTSQVSDVMITSRDFRHLVLMHGILSFAFNTVILALAISTASGLL